MKKYLLSFLVFLFLFIPLISHAGEGLVPYNDSKDFVLTFYSDGGDTVSGCGYEINGVVDKIKIIPSATAVPAASWDLTITTTTDGDDILGGKGANLSETAVTNIVPYDSLSGTYGDVFVDGKLTFNATNTEGGAWRAKVYFRREGRD